MKEAKKILVVEDEVDIVDLLQSLLKSEGYEVACAYNGEDALKMIRHFQPDLILLDMNMPHMGGISFYHEIYDHECERAKYPVLVLTGRTNMERLFSELNVDGFLTKPFDIDRLLDEIQKILLRRRKLATTSTELREDAVPPAARQKPKHVLIVENDTREFEKIALSFLNAGYTVNGATSGVVAFERACSSQPDMILIRMDLTSDMPGDLLACKLRQASETSAIPVLLYSGKELTQERQLVSEICRRFGLREPLVMPNPERLVLESEQALRKSEAA